MKKLIASFLLASILISTLLTGCANVEQSGDDTSGSASTSAANNGNTAQSTDAPQETTEYVPTTEEILGFGKENNNNQKFTIYTTSTKTYDFNIEGETGDLLEDTVYKKNSMIEEYLGVDIELVLEAGNWAKRKTFNAKITNAYASGDDTFDLVNNLMDCTIPLAMQGVFTNVTDLPYTNIEQPWYISDMLENYGIHNKLYIIIGDQSLSLYKDMSVIFFNSTIWKEKKSDVDLYDIVRNGDWTLDKFLELTSDMASDLNGDGQYDRDNDLLAYFGENVPNGTWMTALDIDIIDLNKDGTYNYHGLTDRLADVYAKLAEFRQTVPGVEDINSFTKFPGRYIPSEVFANGQAAMMCNFIYATEHIRDMNDDYGIIPIPKYDKSQEDYIAQVGAAAMVYFVPKIQKNLELTSKFIECQAYFGSTYVTPVYYESTLKAKYADDPNMMEMLDKIRENATIDFLFVYSTSLSSSPFTLLRFTDAIKADLASYFTVNKRVFLESVEKLVNAYKDLE